MSTATNALGLGVDAPQIRSVIHIGIRETMRQYAQESGRAGRDELPNEAIIIQKCWVKRDGRLTYEQGFRTEKEMKDYLQGEQCRRVAMDQEMDGRMDRGGCETDEEACDVYRGGKSRKRRYIGGRKRRKRRRIIIHGRGQQGQEEEEEEEEEVEEEAEEEDTYNSKSVIKATDSITDTVLREELSWEQR